VSESFAYNLFDQPISHNSGDSLSTAASHRPVRPAAFQLARLASRSAKSCAASMIR